MRKILLVVLSVMFITGAVTYVFATDGGMDDPRPMGGMMGDQKRQGSMMMHGDMMNGMGLHMKHTTGLMQRMYGVMHKDMNPSDMRKMSTIMMDMSLHIKYMAEIMSRGNASQEEMHHISNHVKVMEKSFNMMELK
jgi:hypothetical protein